MSKRTVKIFSLLFAVMMLFSIMMPLSVFAAGKTTVVIAGDDVNKIDKAFTELSKDYGATHSQVRVVGGKITIMGAEGNVTSDIISWDSSGKTITFDGDKFENADKKAKTVAMKAFTEALTDADVSTSCRQNIADKLSEGTSQANAYLIGLTLDSTNADIFTALKWLGPILQFMRIIIGVGAIVIILLLVASTVMDCCYIGLPMWREAQANKDGGSDKPFGVSMEALSTVKEIESSIDGGKYKNAYLLYFRRRALTYIILAICILYLIAGELGGLIQGLLNMVSGFTA